MTSDQEPRYRLVDDEGNIVGSLYGKADGSIAIQETDSGADREVALAPDGTFSAPSVETESVSTEQLAIDEALLTYSNKERVAGTEISSTQDPIDETISWTSVDDEVGYLIEIRGIIGDSSSALTMTVGGHTNSNYDYTSRQRATFSNTDGDSSFDVIAGGSGANGFRMLYHLATPRGRPQISSVFTGRARDLTADMLYSGQVDATGLTLNQITFGDARIEELDVDVIALGGN